MTTLEGKTALVTGASRGIGRATAAALANAGAHVLVHYGRSAKEAESLVAEIQAKGGRANAVSSDLRIPDGAALLAVGFWKRTAFIRWQALLLLVFTIAKTFLYDMRDLSQGYRVVSFLGLGALLMAISFAYQKDWLALRDAHPDPTPKAGQ